MAANFAPSSPARTFTANEDSALTVAAAAGRGLLADFTNTGANLRVDVASVTQPAKGNVTLEADGSFTYTPARDATGSDSFIFRAQSENNCTGAATSSANVTVSLTIGGPQNRAHA